MVIYGVTLLSVCYFIGVLLGDILGQLVGVGSNVGGVGFAMILLIILSNKFLNDNHLSKQAQDGLNFWSSMYIPIVVAMTCGQNVYAAITAGPLAILAGIIAVLVGFLLMPLISKIGKPAEPLPPLTPAKED